MNIESTLPGALHHGYTTAPDALPTPVFGAAARPRTAVTHVPCAKTVHAIRPFAAPVARPASGR